MKERKLAAIMFTDIVRYTALMGAGEDHLFEILLITNKWDQIINKTLVFSKL